MEPALGIQPQPGQSEPFPEEGCSEESKSKCVYRAHLSAPRTVGAQSVAAMTWHRSHHHHQDGLSTPCSSHLRCASTELGSQAELGPTLAAGTRLRSTAEPPTILMDLRPKEPSDQGSSERYTEQ